MKKENLISRHFRISKEHDKLIKKNAKEHGGESAFVRRLLDLKINRA